MPDLAPEDEGPTGAFLDEWVMKELGKQTVQQAVQGGTTAAELLEMVNLVTTDAVTAVAGSLQQLRRIARKRALVRPRGPSRVTRSGA